jgi:hypothetical protein
MGIIKLGFISLIVFALVITGISLFFPSHIRISKATEINASRDSILKQINDAANWKQWYPGADTMELLITDGKAKGLLLDNLQGVISISNISDSAVVAAIAGPAIRETITGWNIFDGSTPNMIVVQWYMDFHLRWYPWEKFSSLLLEKRYGPMMQQGLDKLKNFLEK